MTPVRTTAWLRDTLSAIDRIWFGDALAADGVTITWMRWRKTKHSFRYGAFDMRRRVIMINPVLALDFVPEFVVARTILHEAMHHVHGEDHSEEFLRAEQTYPHWAADHAWTSRIENLNRLIAARPPRMRA